MNEIETIVEAFRAEWKTIGTNGNKRRGCVQRYRNKLTEAGVDYSDARKMLFIVERQEAASQ